MSCQVLSVSVLSSLVLSNPVGSPFLTGKPGRVTCPVGCLDPSSRVGSSRVGSCRILSRPVKSKLVPFDQAPSNRGIKEKGQVIAQPAPVVLSYSCPVLSCPVLSRLVQTGPVRPLLNGDAGESPRLLFHVESTYGSHLISFTRKRPQIPLFRGRKDPIPMNCPACSRCSRNTSSVIVVSRM